jgi:hypothetical protein
MFHSLRDPAFAYLGRCRRATAEGAGNGAFCVIGLEVTVIWHQVREPTAAHVESFTSGCSRCVAWFGAGGARYSSSFRLDSISAPSDVS